MSELKEVFTWISNNGVSTVLLFLGVYFLYRMLSNLLVLAKQAFLDPGGYVESYRNASNATVDLTSHIKEYDSRQLAMCEKHSASIDGVANVISKIGGVTHENQGMTHEKLNVIIESLQEACEGINRAAEYVQPEVKDIIKKHISKMEEILRR